MMLRQSTAAMAAVLLSVALAACAPSTPTPSSTPSAATPTPTGTPTATPEPEMVVAATILVSGQQVVVLDADGNPIDTIGVAENGDQAAARLATALGVEPTTATAGTGNCSPRGTSYDFGGFAVQGQGDIIMAPPGAFTVHVSAAATAGGVAIEGPGGVVVGMPLADLLAAVPGVSPVDNGFGAATVNLDPIAGVGTADEAGLLGYIEGGVLTRMITPVYIFGDC